MTLSEPLYYFSDGSLLNSVFVIIVLIRQHPLRGAPTCKQIGVKIISVLREHYDKVIANRVLHIPSIPENNLSDQFGCAVASMEENVNFTFGGWSEALIRIVNVTILVEAIIIIYERIITEELVLDKLSQDTFRAPVYVTGFKNEIWVHSGV